MGVSGLENNIMLEWLINSVNPLVQAKMGSADLG